MKKVISILLVIASLFTLSLSAVCCAYESTENSNKKIQREININSFIDNHKEHCPENTITAIKSMLNGLNDYKLELALHIMTNSEFMFLASLFLGESGRDIYKDILELITSKDFFGIIWLYDVFVTASGKSDQSICKHFCNALSNNKIF